jgi:two-component system response regulator TctD
MGEFSSTVEYGNLSFDRASANAQVGDTQIELPRRELSILSLLLSHEGRTLSKAQIATELSSFDTIDDMPSDNAIESYIARLRKKLSPSNVRIKTLRGIGYMLYVEK